MAIVTSIFEVIGEAVESFATMLGSAVTSITSLFYNAESGFTFVGVLVLIAAGIGIVYWVVRLIRGLLGRTA